MTLVNRTAYPRFRKQFTQEELCKLYDLNHGDLAYIKSSSKGDKQRLTFASLLKTYHNLGYFPSLRDIPDDIRKHLANQLGLDIVTSYLDEEKLRPSLHRYKEVIRSHLQSKPYTSGGREYVENLVRHAAHTMSDPADLINAAVERLKRENIELPAFSTLDRAVRNIRQQVHLELYAKITKKLSVDQINTLEALLVVPAGEKFTPFNKLKQNPGPATLNHTRSWAEHLHDIEAILNPTPFIEDIAHTKIRQFASEAEVLQVSELLDMQLNKRHALLLCFLHHVQTRVRDELVEMFLRRTRRTVSAAKVKLKTLQDEHRTLEENLIQTFGQILSAAESEEKAAHDLGRDVKTILEKQGGIEKLRQQYDAASAYHQNNYRPLLWNIHAKHRSVLFRLLKLLKIHSATQDRSLLLAFEYVMQHHHTRRDFLPFDINLGFTSQNWRTFIIKRQNKTQTLNRRALEVCVFIHLADALDCGDIYVDGCEIYSDPRAQLLPWDECEPRLDKYCKHVGLPSDPNAFISFLQEQLSSAAKMADAHFPKNSELTIDPNGIPHLKQQKKAEKPDNLAVFQAEIRARMPERHLLDILKYTNCWTEYTRHFGPPSGSQPKLSDHITRYLFAIFSNGCLLGDSQIAKHAPLSIDRQTLQRINAQHINIEKLESALTDLINEYKRFGLAKFWGEGQAAIADGTHIALVENNLLGERHIRYGGYGGIAYHHISNNYIALFCNFIACGVWEGVYILDGLWQNASNIQPDTLHADTHGQSEPIFGLAHLLGIKLFPRMRNWNDVTFYRSQRTDRYQHIDALFTDEIDWNLIQTHWPDMMQIVLSIQAGKVLPSMLLRKLGSKNRKNKLYRAFRELGRVERTIFLLRYVSEPSFRFNIRAETTKIESFHSFLDWIAFGGTTIKSGDPVEQAKKMKYMDVIANAVMLQNVADLTNILNDMANEGFKITPELVSSLSPYMRENILRFGKWSLDMNDMPEPLQPKPVPIVS